MAATRGGYGTRRLAPAAPRGGVFADTPVELVHLGVLAMVGGWQGKHALG
jgi:hypothetical protein